MLKINDEVYIIKDYEGIRGILEDLDMPFNGVIIYENEEHYRVKFGDIGSSKYWFFPKNGYLKKLNKKTTKVKYKLL